MRFTFKTSPTFSSMRPTRLRLSGDTLRNTMRDLLVALGLLLPLAVDTFALAAALGMAGLDRSHRLRVALVFTAFEAGMPIAGILLGRAAGTVLGQWAGYGGILFLFIAGWLLLRDGGHEEAGTKRIRLLAHARGLAIIDLGLSISVDELAVGLSAGLLGLAATLTVAWIALQAFVATQLGLTIGQRLGERARERSEKLAGIMLIAVALILLVLRLVKS
jgi:putative Mn2+ efflux pump MntP